MIAGEPHGNGIWTGIARVGWVVLTIVGLLAFVGAALSLSFGAFIAGCVGAGVVIVAIVTGAVTTRRR